MRRKRVSVVPVVLITCSSGKMNVLKKKKSSYWCSFITVGKEKKKVGEENKGRVDRQGRGSGGGGVVEVASYPVRVQVYISVTKAKTLRQNPKGKKMRKNREL